MEPRMPVSLQLVFTSAYQASDRAWSGLQSFLVVQSILAVAWASITQAQNWTSKLLVLLVISITGMITGLLWSLLGTRMWHYHLEYAARLRRITEAFTEEREGLGATIWKEVDDEIDRHWRSDRGWFKWLSGNHWILFIAPLFLSLIHLVMLSWALWSFGEASRYAVIATWVIFWIGFAYVWQICRPVLGKDYYGTFQKQRS